MPSAGNRQAGRRIARHVPGGQRVLVKRFTQAHHDAMFTRESRLQILKGSDMIYGQQWHGVMS